MAGILQDPLQVLPSKSPPQLYEADIIVTSVFLKELTLRAGLTNLNTIDILYQIIL